MADLGHALDEMAELLAGELAETVCTCPACGADRILQLRDLVRRVNEDSNG